MGWKRWLRYGRAKVDATVRDIDDALDRKEAALEDEARAKPWLADDDAVPTLEDVKRRVEGDEPTPAAPDFDLAAQQREADERLAKIRESLGVDDPPAKES
jgi:hypothetical protein